LNKQPALLFILEGPAMRRAPHGINALAILKQVDLRAAHVGEETVKRLRFVDDGDRAGTSRPMNFDARSNPCISR